MADSTVGLMFEIAVDPSKALAALEDFRQQADKTLSNIGGSSASGSPSAGAGPQSDPIGAQARSMASATAPLVTQSMAQMGTAETHQIGVLQQLAGGFEQLDAAADRAFAHMARAHQNYETTALAASQRITLALLQQADAGEKLSAAGVASAAAQATGVIKNVKAQAAIKTVFEAAEAVAAFASWDFEGGALHLLASAEFAAVAATSAGGGGGAGGSGSLSRSPVQSRASGGYGGGGGAAGVGYGPRGSTSTTASESVGGGAAMAQGSQPPLPNSEPLHLIVIGPSQQARFFAQQMSAAVAAGHFVPSSNTRRPAPAVRSG